MPPQPPQAGEAELKRHEACGSHARFAFVSDSGWSLEAFCNAPGTNDMPLKPNEGRKGIGQRREAASKRNKSNGFEEGEGHAKSRTLIRTFSYLANIGMSDKERVGKNAGNNEKKFLWRLVRSVSEQLRDDLGQT